MAYFFDAEIGRSGEGRDESDVADRCEYDIQGWPTYSTVRTHRITKNYLRPVPGC